VPAGWKARRPSAKTVEVSSSRRAQPTAAIAGYRFRATFGARLGGYLAVVALLGLLGGVALAALASARRTDSSYPRFLATTNPSDFFVQPTTQGRANCGTVFFRDLERLPHVRKVECATALQAETLRANDTVGTVLLTKIELIASNDGMFGDIDRATLTGGRLPEPTSLDQVVASPEAASLLHLRLGSTVRVGIDLANQSSVLPPYRTVELRVVGLAVFNHQVVQDDIDKDHTGILLGSPALARAFAGCCSGVPYDGIQVAGGTRDVALVDREYGALVRRVNPANPQLLVYESSVNEAATQRAIRPQAIALAVFGGIAALAALVIAGMAVARELRARRDEAEVLRALGASPGAVLADGLLGSAIAVVLGAATAALVAFLLSPITDFGPVGAVDPARGWNADWTVLGFGVLGLAAVVGAVGLVTALRHAPGRDRAGHEERGSAFVSWAARLGFPPTGVAGLRFAVEPGRGRTAVPVRSTMVGAVLAVVVLVATLTFGASLSNLISHPALYGWNFDEALFSTDGFGPLPTAAFTPILYRDPDIAATTPVWFSNLQIDGATVPALAEPLHAAVQPVALMGTPLESSRDLVLGTSTLQRLGLAIGDTVVVSGNGLPSERLTIVGTAGFPAIGPTFTTHASMSTGALLPTEAIPTPALDEGIPPAFAGPNALFVRNKPGVSASAGHRALQRVVDAFLRLSRSPRIVALTGGLSSLLTIDNLAVQRPAEIVNYKSMGATPGVLAGALALGTEVALALTLVASARRRRRDFAVLKTLGFTGRQLSGTVAWQATTVVVVGLVAGIPLGIVAGRWLWELFAREIAVVVAPAVPALLVTVVALAALVLGNLVAALPGRMAARTSPAFVLRSE